MDKYSDEALNIDYEPTPEELLNLSPSERARLDTLIREEEERLLPLIKAATEDSKPTQKDFDRYINVR